MKTVPTVRVEIWDSMVGEIDNHDYYLMSDIMEIYGEIKVVQISSKYSCSALSTRGLLFWVWIELVGLFFSSQRNERDGVFPEQHIPECYSDMEQTTANPVKSGWNRSKTQLAVSKSQKNKLSGIELELLYRTVFEFSLDAAASALIANCKIAVTVTAVLVYCLREAGSSFCQR